MTTAAARAHRHDDARPIAELHREADLGAVDRTLQVVGQGVLGLTVGVTLALTGPTTPSFALLAALPGWPILYGVAHSVVCSVLLVCRFRRATSLASSVALVLMGLGYAAVGLVVWRTWLLWHVGGEHGSEPLLVAVPFCFAVATHCGYLAGVLYLRRRRALVDATG